MVIRDKNVWPMRTIMLNRRDQGLQSRTKVKAKENVKSIKPNQEVQSRSTIKSNGHDQGCFQEKTFIQGKRVDK